MAGVDADPLLESGFRLAALDRLVSLVGRDKAGIVLAHMASAQAVRQLATEIETAASRIHSLVAAVKGFTYVNQQSTLQPIAIGRGLSDTVTVLRSKARAKSVAVDVVVPADLPAVDGYGGELNQVWANLLDNAIDATPGGHVRVDASTDAGHVVVRVTDDGPGIPRGDPGTASSIRSSPRRTSGRAPASASTSRAASSSATRGRSTCTRAAAGRSSA